MKQQRTTPVGRLGKAKRSLRLEPLEGRLLLHGNGVDPHEPVQTELLQSMRSFLSSVAGGLAASQSLVESAPDGCGLTAVDQGPIVADQGWLAGGGQFGSAATGDLELGGITCCCPACLAVADLDAPENATALADAGPAGATVPLSSLPILNSLAGAAVSLYLNFVGHFEAFWGVYSNITTPAFNTDGDATTFSSAELDAIQTIWSIVAEDYAPFNVNVTTVAPPTLANGVAVSVAIGGNGAWTGGTYGGITYTDSFTSFMPNVGFVFSSNLGNNPKSVGDAVSHEAGHTFGLLHQSQYDAGGNLIREYSTGTGDGRAPIMGNSAAADRGLWWYGTAGGPTNYQDDMAVITRIDNGFGYRTDDHGNSPAAATTLTPVGSLLSGAGIIETTSDQDYFAFSTAAGQVTLSVDVLAANINNLDARLELRDDDGNLIASAAPANTFYASITASVNAGNYLLVVASQGAYGDVGQYTVSGTIVVSSGVAAPTNLVGAAASGPSVQLAWTDHADNETYYEVWRSPDANSWGLLATLTADSNSYTDTTVAANATYYYRVRAGNVSQSSTDSNQVQVTLPPLSINQPPSGTDKAITLLEDATYTLTTADFGFGDPNDSPANSLLAVKITALPAAGSLTRNGAAVAAGQFITAADITAGLLRFTPAANASGTSYTSFAFQVQDNGGTANGGIDLDPTANAITFHVTAVNDAPVGANQTVTTPEDIAYTFVVTDFGFSDPDDAPANALQAVKITTLPSSGQLTHLGVAVVAGQLVTAADIAAGNLKFLAAAAPLGPSPVSLTFQVQDHGGTANGGVDLDLTPRTLTLNVTESANQNFVRALYLDILQRAPDSGGLRDWTNQLNSGASRTQIATGLWNCFEHRAIQVDSYYQKFLYRAADPGGRQFWIQSMLDGMSEETAMALFMTTIEYQQRSPLNSSFVGAVFQDLLVRAPTSAELAERTAALDSNTLSRHQLVQDCLNSNERHLQLVDSYYQVYFGRQPDPGGRAFWTSQLDQGNLNDRGVALALMVTPEYFNRSQIR